MTVVFSIFSEVELAFEFGGNPGIQNILKIMFNQHSQPANVIVLVPFNAVSWSEALDGTFSLSGGHLLWINSKNTIIEYQHLRTN